MSAAHPLRHFVVALYRRGELATLEEGALIGAVSRRRVMAWLEAERVDWIRERQRFIARHRSRGAEIVEGKPARPRMTKARLRARGKWAKAQWDRRG